MNTGTLYCMHGLAGLALLPAGAIAIEASIISNYFFNSRWTFADKPGGSLQKFCKFHMVSAIPVFANLGILLIFADFGVWYIFANFMGILAGVSWNYLVNVKWTWK